jgi:hypothetical protein
LPPPDQSTPNRKPGAGGRVWLLVGAVALVILSVAAATLIRGRQRTSAGPVPAPDQPTKGIFIGGTTSKKNRRELQTVSPRSAITDPLLLEILNAHDAKLDALMKEYSAAANALQEPPLLDFTGVKRSDELKLRMELVKKYLAANERVMTFLVTEEQAQRDGLTARKLPHDTVQATARAYHEQLAAHHDLQIKVRETDRRMGVALLGMLEVLEDTWGRWKYNAERKKVDFDETADLNRYLNFRNHMDTAAQEQKQWQNQLAALPAV